MRGVNRYLALLGLTMVLSGLVSCGSGGELSEESYVPVWPEDYDPEVTLALRVSVGETTGQSGSRSGSGEAGGLPAGGAAAAVRSGEDDYSYENPSGNLGLYEKINTLRVIIVRPDRTVEYNRLVALSEDEAVDRFDKLEFKVSTSQGETKANGSTLAVTRTETKRIYLIANESSIPSVEIREALASLGTKSRLSDETASGWTIWSDWGQGAQYAVPALDNSGQTGGFVPMSESFDVDVKSDLVNPGPNLYQEAHLFVTRAYVKFEFALESDTETCQITAIQFENLMQKEYLFPNSAVYSPGKYDSAELWTDAEGNEISGRQIISFSTPGTGADENLVRPFVFEPENFGVSKLENTDVLWDRVKGFETSYIPWLYFCETNNNEANENNQPIYKVSIVANIFHKDGTIEEDVVFPAQILPNLPNSLPRNTIVKVNMKIKDHNVYFTTTLLPYTGVWLNPIFGV